MNSVWPQEQHRLSAVIAKISLAFYLGAVFFGTSLPFRDVVTEIEDKTSSNLFNQVLFSAVFVASAISLWPLRSSAATFIRREKLLAAFMAWCFLSCLWSAYPAATLKRAFQILTGVIVFLAALLHMRRSTDALGHFEAICGLYLPLSLLSVILVPGAIDPLSMTWRGLASSKNHLGQAAVVAALLWFMSFRLRHDWRRRAAALVMLGISLVLLAGSRSVTSSVTLCGVAAVGMLSFITSRLMPRSLAGTFVVLATFTAIAMIMWVFTASEGALAAVTHSLGKEETFSGRTDLWSSVFEYAASHPLLGTGYGSFWIADNPDVRSLYEEFVWLPNQAHMGYLDIFNETGAIGIMLAIGMATAYFKRLARLKERHFWQWILLAALLANLQETTLFRPNFIVGIMFIFAYVALHADLMRQEELPGEVTSVNQLHAEEEEL